MSARVGPAHPDAIDQVTLHTIGVDLAQALVDFCNMIDATHAREYASRSAALLARDRDALAALHIATRDLDLAVAPARLGMGTHQCRSHDQRFVAGRKWPDQRVVLLDDGDLPPGQPIAPLAQPLLTNDHHAVEQDRHNLLFLDLAELHQEAALRLDALDDCRAVDLSPHVTALAETGGQKAISL